MNGTIHSFPSIHTINSYNHRISPSVSLLKTDFVGFGKVEELGFLVKGQVQRVIGVGLDGEVLEERSGEYEEFSSGQRFTWALPAT